MSARGTFSKLYIDDGAARSLLAATWRSCLWSEWCESNTLPRAPKARRLTDIVHPDVAP